MTATTILLLVIAVLVIQFVFEELLDNINQKHFEGGLPNSLSGIYTDEKYQKAVQYGKEKGNFGLWSGLITLVATLAVLYFGYLGKLSDYIFNLYPENSMIQTLVFFGILTLLSSILGLPFSYYSNFVIEEKFGFNKMTKGLFFMDTIKGLLVSFVVGGLLISIFLWLYQQLGANFWIYFWAVAVVFIVFTNMFYTSLILPLFNKLSPLEEGELKTAIENYSQKNGFNLDGIYVIDGSKRSTKANAFFSGFGPNKKVVLYDTLIKNHSTDELVAVLAHEIGHYKHKHIIWSMLIAIGQIGAILWLLSNFLQINAFSEALGAKNNAIHLNMFVFFSLFSPISTLIGVLFNIFSRKNEYEADKFAKDTFKAEPLINGLKNLSVDSLSNINPHPLYVFINHSHPSLAQRIESLKK
jgi:STE24 endopeptidase